MNQIKKTSGGKTAYSRHHVGQERVGGGMNGKMSGTHYSSVSVCRASIKEYVFVKYKKCALLSVRSQSKLIVELSLNKPESSLFIISINSTLSA